MAQTSRFEGLDFSTHVVSEVTPHLLETLGGGFRCKRGEFVTYWRGQRIRRDIQTYMCRCWVIYSGSYLAGYITLLTDKLVLNEEKLANEEVPYQAFPAVKIGLLAADKRAKGAGTRLVEWAMEYVATQLVHRVGVRFMTVDAFYDFEALPEPYDASGFYEKLGFRFVDPDEAVPPKDSYRTMYFDLKPLIEALNS